MLLLSEGKAGESGNIKKNNILLDIVDHVKEMFFHISCASTPYLGSGCQSPPSKTEAWVRSRAISCGICGG
jgi:hypothetical protein